MVQALELRPKATLSAVGSIGDVFPKLLAGTVTGTVNGEMVISHGSNLERLTDPGTVAWLGALLPFFDGARPLSDLTDGLAPEQGTVVRELVRFLLDRRFIRNAAFDEEHHLTPAIVRRHASEIAYIESFVDSPERKFERWARTRFALICPDPLALEIATTLRSLGASSITRASLETFLRPSRQDKPIDQNSSSAVLYVASSDDSRGIGGLAARCRAAGQFFVGLAASGAEAWVGPYPSSKSCWECAYRRVGSSMRSFDSPLLRVAGNATPPVARMLIAVACFELFSAITGCHEDLLDSRTIMHVDLHTFASERRVYASHPRCGSCRPISNGTLAVDCGPRARHVTKRAFLTRSVAMVDSRIGLVRSLTEYGLSQLPFSATRLQLAGESTSGAFIGVGRDLAEARRDAVVQAMEWHSEHHFRLSASRRLGSGWLISRSRPRAVNDRSRIARQDPKAVGVGLSWQEAAYRAVCNLTLRLVLSDSSAINAFCLLMPDTSAERELTTSIRQAEAAGLGVEVVEILSPLGLSVFVVLSGDEVLGVSSHPDPAVAIVQAVRQATVHFQNHQRLRVVPTGWKPRVTGPGRVFSPEVRCGDHPPDVLAAVCAALANVDQALLLQPVRVDAGFGNNTPFALAASRVGGTK